MMTEQEHSNVQWRKVKLGDCLKQKPDYGINAPAVPYDNNLPTYLRITDITEDGRYSKKDVVSVANPDALKYVLEEGDLVFARTGASVGKTYLYDSKDGMLVFAGFLIRVKTDENILLPEFFKYQTHTPRYKNWISANSMRTGQPGINGNEYEEFTFSIPFKNNKPDLAEQRRIAAILSSADKVIAATQKTIAKYKQMKQGMMEELLKPKEGWKMVKLGECCDKITDGCHIKPKCVAKSQFLMLSSQNIKDNKLDLSDVSYLTFDDFERENHRTNIKAGDVLLTIVGTVGRTYLVKENDVNFTLQRSVAVLAPKAILDSSFLLYTLNNLQFVLENEAHGCAQKGIYLKQLNQLLISIPDLAEQRRIAAILSGIDAKIAAEEKVLEKYEKVKKGLMERLLEE